MNVNFNGFGENAATFIADKTITEAGVPVKMKDNGTVAKCDASESFCGVCVSVRGGYAVVQLSGYVKVKSDKKIAVGYKSFLQRQAACRLQQPAESTLCLTQQTHQSDLFFDNRRKILWQILKILQLKRVCIRQMAEFRAHLKSLIRQKITEVLHLRDLTHFPVSSNALILRLRAETATALKVFSEFKLCGTFPEYVSRAVMQGMERADILPNLVATVTDIEGMDYRSIASVPSEDDKSLKLVGEGAKIPQTEVKTRENLVKLHKRGRMLVASYEALRFQRLDLFTVTLNQIGAYIARAQLKDAIDVLVNGDGNENPAGTLNVATGGKVTYEDLLKLWTELAPYELNTILASTPEMQKILSLSQLQDSNAGLDFQATGRMITPLGASLLHTPELEGGKIIGLDKNCALEMVQAGGVVTDYDKLIDRQLERAAVTCTAGFSKIFTEASKVMSC